ncbi:uncharacterized protein N7518_007950 [Penicillium psychrosexuale]|uniref:uncharacterized protein n=1 Tax=Penicillium psychrosexuale TaxID=1002107 RepID=UPI0025453288|nr:uncharacterized protein N7518_007950 [Penicillium psychrosexuale]KAJ5790939.1 hypothetical protein N7518_007950 [Penicillium psychrosexuale]
MSEQKTTTDKIMWIWLDTLERINSALKATSEANAMLRINQRDETSQNIGHHIPQPSMGMAMVHRAAVSPHTRGTVRRPRLASPA